MESERQVTTPDGWVLRAHDVQPDGPASALVVAGHAMMVDSRTLWRPDRPSLVGTLVRAGMRVLVPDLRGHGMSGPRAEQGGNWTYDQLVADTEVWFALATELADGLPVLWLSHSLFGHTSLAWFGQHPERQPRAFVALAVNVWNRRFEPNPVLWLFKSAMMRAARRVAEHTGRLPARQMRMGNNDEALDYWRDLARMATGRWTSRLGVDYYAELSRVTVRILCIFSDGDKLFTRPADGIAFTAPLVNRQVLTLGKTCEIRALDGIVPDHMGLATDVGAEPLWQHVAAWLLHEIA